VQLDPNNADAWNNLGWSLAKLGFRADAARAYERTLAIDPDYERAKNNLRALGT
jgi:Flp pilus assembly protein TadD